MDRTVPSSTTGLPAPAGGRRRRLVAFSIALAAASSLALAFDLDVARWCQAGHLPGELRRLLNFAEVFAHGMGVAVILLVAIALDPSLAARGPGDRRRAMFGFLGLSGDCWRMIAAAVAGGIMVDVIKAAVDRVRPRATDLASVASALATFGTAAAVRITSHSDVNSFPSGHAAMATGLAAALSWKYPRAAWLFAALAIAAATQRVATSAHYPSDVLLGAALGLAGAAVFLGASPDRERPPG
jgi:membrane-associated phospholipid phosphatase